MSIVAKRWKDCNLDVRLWQFFPTLSDVKVADYERDRVAVFLQLFNVAVPVTCQLRLGSATSAIMIEIAATISVKHATLLLTVDDVGGMIKEEIWKTGSTTFGGMQVTILTTSCVKQ